METNNLNKQTNKQILVVGDLGVGGERGRVLSDRGSCAALSATEWKDPTKVLVEYDKRDRD